MPCSLRGRGNGWRQNRPKARPPDCRGCSACWLGASGRLNHVGRPVQRVFLTALQRFLVPCHYIRKRRGSVRLSNGETGRKLGLRRDSIDRRNETTMTRSNLNERIFRMRGLPVLLPLALTSVAAYGAAPTYTDSVLHNFPPPPKGAGSESSLILDAAGNLFGTTLQGGAANDGVVFRLNTNGTLTVLHDFSGGADGAQPSGAVIRDSKGNLYGTTSGGGAANAGTLYKVDIKGKETVLHNFGGPGDGANPYCTLFRDAEGNMYGTTLRGGAYGDGTVFKLDPANNETILYSFQNSADGDGPGAGVVQDSAGNLYGAAGGGSAGLGVIFKLDPSGNEMVLHSFLGGNDGVFSVGGLILDTKGNLYGATLGGGSANMGTVFEIDAAGNETVLHSFTGTPDGSTPLSGVILDSTGNLYGTTADGGTEGHGIVYEISASGSESVLFNFPSSNADGTGPYGLILDSAGNLYGATSAGGLDGNGYGVVYRRDTAGNVTVLYSFPAPQQGADPVGGVVSSGGDFYGVTSHGGKANLGVLYKLDAAGNETVLHTFSGGDDAYPVGLTEYGGKIIGAANGASIGGELFAVVNGTAKIIFLFNSANGSHPNIPTVSGGKIYGTTTYGGPSGVAGAGVLYELDSGLNQTILHAFTGGADGGYPGGSVVVDKVGNIYGTTSCGGTGSSLSCAAGAGVVFKFDTAGNYSVLYNFSGGADGAFPTGALALDVNGNLFGTTDLGGATTVEPFGSGVVWEVDSAGNESTFYTFTGSSDGGNPPYGVVRDPSGNLYGVTSGNVFELNPAGQLTVLLNFTGTSDGYDPSGGVILSPPDVYGTTYSGGTGGSGTVFKIAP